ncbi:MAG: hypothetical protein Q9225_006807 [Loekoesia sp. 1 TL-2023]
MDENKEPAHPLPSPSALPLFHHKCASIDTVHGSSVWLLDLAKKLQTTVRLDGFDVDISHAPPPQWLPINVTIRAVDSYTSRPPETLIQAYDIVRVANIASSIKDNDPGAVIKNVIAMLKPGGYIQWQEADTAHRRIIKSNPSLPSPRLEVLLKYVEDQENSLGPRGWIDSLPDILARYGLGVLAVQHRHRMPDAYAKVETDCCFLEFEHLARVLDAQGEGRGERLREMLALAAEECAGNGQGVRVDVVVAVARKEE